MELSPLHNAGNQPLNNASVAAGPNAKAAASPQMVVDNYTPPDIRDSLHRAETINETAAVAKTPRLVNAGGQFFMRAFRYLFGAGAAVAGTLAAATLFLINAKIAFLFALPAAGCLAAFVALKPQEYLGFTLHDDKDINTLMTAATDEESGRPESIGPELIPVIEKIGRSWGSLPVKREEADKNLRYEEYLKVYYYLEKLKSKLVPIAEIYNSGKNLPGLTLAGLKRLQDTAANVYQDMATYLKSKGVRLEEAHS
jgi:hypothetical protein